MRAWWRWLIVLVVGAVSIWMAAATGLWLADVAIGDGEAPLAAYLMAALAALGFGWAFGHLPYYAYRLLSRQERILARRKRHRTMQPESFFDEVI